MSKATILVRVDEHELLQPFTDILESLICQIGEENSMRPSGHALEDLTRRIDHYLRRASGYGSHPALWLTSLMVCCRFYQRAIEAIGDPEYRESQQEILDSAVGLIECLRYYHRVPYSLLNRSLSAQ